MPFVNNLPMGKGYTKSNYKLQCHVCNGTIHRGDDIAQCEEYDGWTSMTLRVRLTKDHKSFYTPETGARWVHKNCNPGFWTTYTVIAQAEEDNREMNDVMEYITNRLGLKSDTSLSINCLIKKAYEVLGARELVGLTIREELGYIKYLIEKRNND